jgi:peptide/nickel transport system ATP-binding protein
MARDRGGAGAGLHVEHLRKVFVTRTADGAARRELVAVDDVSFDVPSGSCLAIVGETGSGKTTVARMIAGLIRADRGEVTVGGRLLPMTTRSSNARKSRARLVQMVFQDPYSSLDPRQTVGRGLEELLRVHDHAERSRCRERALAVLEQVGLDERHARSRPRQLSGGERQRVAIARALAINPDVLVLDEPLAALDMSIQAQILNLLTDIRDSSNTAYVFITHDMSVIRQISEYAAVMRDGQIVEQGRTSDVLEAPSHPYTKALLEAVPRRGWKPPQVLRSIEARSVA